MNQIRLDLNRHSEVNNNAIVFILHTIAKWFQILYNAQLQMSQDIWSMLRSMQ